MNKQDRTDAFRKKNERRRLNRDADPFGTARELRKQGVHMTVKTTVPTELGEPIVETDIVSGTPGAFGNATNAEWNERIPGTSGVER